MIIHKETYGADIDNNRGTEKVSYQLDTEDDDEIGKQIIEYIQSTNTLPKDPFTVHLVTPDTYEDIHFNIDPFYYLTEKDCKEYLEG